MGNRTGRGVGAEEALRVVLALPGIEQCPHGNLVGFRVHGKGFAYLCDDDQSMLIKATREERAALVDEDPRAYKKSYSSGRFGWVQVRLPKARLVELEELITEAWRLTAPRRMVADLDRVHELA